MASSEEMLSNFGETNTKSTHGVYVTELTDNDVLLGRGQPILNYSGNIRFRKLIQRHKEAYTSTGKHSAKHEIANQILGTIEERGGRFLRKIEETKEREEMRIPDDVMHAWLVVDDAVKLQKVKQALREQLSKQPPDARPQKPRRKKRDSGSEEEIDDPKRPRASIHDGNFQSSQLAGRAAHNFPQQLQQQAVGTLAAQGHTEPLSLLNVGRHPIDMLPPDAFTTGNMMLDRNSMLAQMKDQPLNPQMLFYLQQQRRSEALAVLQQQSHQHPLQPSQAAMMPGTDQTSMMFNQMRMIPQAPSAFVPSYFASRLDRPASLQDAVQHYLVSQQQQQQQQYNPQALIAPLEPAPFHTEDSGVLAPGGASEATAYKKEESSGSSSSEGPIGEPDIK